MQNIVKLFPDIFEIESVDRKWYETFGMCQEKVEVVSKVFRFGWYGICSDKNTESS